MHQDKGLLAVYLAQLDANGAQKLLICSSVILRCRQIIWEQDIKSGLVGAAVHSQYMSHKAARFRRWLTCQVCTCPAAAAQQDRWHKPHSV